MPDGLYPTNTCLEPLHNAETMRERMIVVNTNAPTARDVSGFANFAPGPFQGSPGSAPPLTGPHFVLSPVTPDNQRTTGFEWMLTDYGVEGAATIDQVTGAEVQIWKYFPNTSAYYHPSQPGLFGQMALTTGVQFNQLFRSFDVNACAIYFQFGGNGFLTPGSVGILMTEL